MKDVLKGLTVLFFYTSLLIYPQPVEAIRNTPKAFDQSEVAFLADYVTYLKFRLHLHGTEIKKKIACLGGSANDLYPSYFDLKGSEDTIKALNKAFEEYIESDDCDIFIYETLPEIEKTFTEMRVQLGLYQAKSLEVDNKLKPHRGYFNSMNPEFLQCDSLKNPIYVRDTMLCLERLLSVVNINPSHLVKTSHFVILDDLVYSKDLPEISDLPPLTWPEVFRASKTFQEHYTNNEITTYSKDTSYSKENRPKFENSLEKLKFYREHPEERQLDTYGLDYLKYMAARKYQSPPGLLITEYPEKSAPYKYTQALTKYPFLAFLEPEIREKESNCEESLFVTKWRPKLLNLCKKYLQNLNGRTPFTLEITKKSVVKALEKTLEINYALLRRIDENYPVANLMNENKELLKKKGYFALKPWSELMKMENLNEHFFKVFPKHAGKEERFVKIKEDSETRTLVITLAGTIVLGMGCYYIGNIPAFIACMGVAGIGLNVIFYAQAYKDYEDNFEMFFATDTTTEELLSFTEFSTLEDSRQGLYLESLFLLVGLGVGDIVRRVRNAERMFQK